LVFHADSVADTDEEEVPGENSSESSGGSQEDPSGHDKKDDWDLATRYRDIQRFGHLEPKVKKEMSEKAIRVVLERAKASLGPVQKPYRYQSVSLEEAVEHEADGGVVELDIEESLQNAEPVFQARVEKNHGIVLLLDTSLSMKGEKLALLGVTIAAVAASVPSESLCILGFDSEIHPIKEFKENAPFEQLVRRVLEIPPGGFTHIERGLQAARLRIKEGRYPEARVILVSDGRFTEGRHPIEEARMLPFVYTVKLGKDPSGWALMRELAASGRGLASQVREMKDLPRFLLHSIRRWVK